MPHPLPRTICAEELAAMADAAWTLWRSVQNSIGEHLNSVPGAQPESFGPIAGLEWTLEKLLDALRGNLKDEQRQTDHGPDLLDALRIIADGDGDPATIAKQTLQANGFA